jgi:hypothetical protein
MPIAKTVTGRSFEYSGSLATGLTIFFKAAPQEDHPGGDYQDYPPGDHQAAG